MPDKFIITPGGYQRASRVKEVASGSTVRDDVGFTQLLSVTRQVQLHLLDAVEPTTVVVPTDPGWVADAYLENTSGAPLQSFSSTWIVPQPPAQDTNQLIYLFNGLQQDGPSPSILQPVLQWGRSDYGGGPFWSIASWYVQPDNTAFRTPLVQVTPGTQLVGLMTLTSQDQAGYNYNCEFVGIAGTQLHVASIHELSWCYETLEAYGITDNSSYPIDPAVHFTDISASNPGGVLPANWQVSPPYQTGQRAVLPPASPGCATSVDIYFR